MLVYSSTKTGFLKDVRSNEIERKILEAFRFKLHKTTGQSEIDSWKNSMMYMSQIVGDEEVPDDSGVYVEYQLPYSSKRIDFILTGQDEEKRDTAVIVELKQWSEAKVTVKDAIVVTFVGGSEREQMHPSYQAWTYAALLHDYNETIRDQKIQLKPCAYLHNMESDENIKASFYQEHTAKAPVFVRKDINKLRDFLKKHVKYGDKNQIMYRIDQGKISPSKNLADALNSLLQGNEEFYMIDEQKIVFETSLHLFQNSKKKKTVLIVEGGPGTGKSVVAINLLVEFTNRGRLVKYVTKNAAPRQVYESKLTGSFKKSHITNMFTGSGSFTDVEANTFDALIVDEAHRLNEKSGMFQNMGENQVKEIINSAQHSVFFIDENQKVTFQDIGRKEEIRKWAKALGAKVTELELESQFRCNGSDGYLAWIDHALQIRETANSTLDGIDYDFRVYDCPVDLKNAIFEKNKINNKARLVAGYCWDWASKKDKNKDDIVLDKYGFSMKWNLFDDGNLWIVKPEAVKEVGCIHTCQGLELDYVGVIIGPDFVLRDEMVETDASTHPGRDKAIKGYRKLVKENPVEIKKLADEVIKNTYRTLMTRGAKGCFLFCTDPETNEYFKEFVQNQKQYDLAENVAELGR